MIIINVQANIPVPANGYAAYAPAWFSSDFSPTHS